MVVDGVEVATKLFANLGTPGRRVSPALFIDDGQIERLCLGRLFTPLTISSNFRRQEPDFGREHTVTFQFARLQIAQSRLLHLSAVPITKPPSRSPVSISIFTNEALLKMQRLLGLRVLYHWHSHPSSVRILQQVFFA